MALKVGMAPRQDAPEREGNEAAREAAQLALSTAPVEGRHHVRLRKRQIEPDAHQPRRHKKRKAIEDKRESMQHEGQRAPVEVMPTGRRNLQGEPLYRLIDGELRWHGTPSMADWIECIVETRALTEEQIQDRRIASNIAEDFSAADLCSMAWEQHRRFKKTQKLIADGVMRKWANQSEKWVQQRVSVWDKLSPDEFGQPQSSEGQMIDDLLTEHKDAFTHVQAIVSAPKAKWARTVEMVRQGATVPQINAYLYPEKAKAPAKETRPSVSGGSGITIHRGGGGGHSNTSDAITRGNDRLKAIAASPRPTQEEVNAEFEGAFPDEQVVTAQELDNRFDQLRKILTGIQERAPLFKESPEWTPLGAQALRTQARDVALALSDVAEVFRVK